MSNFFSRKIQKAKADAWDECNEAHQHMWDQIKLSPYKDGKIPYVLMNPYKGLYLKYEFAYKTVTDLEKEMLAKQTPPGIGPRAKYVPFLMPTSLNWEPEGGTGWLRLKPLRNLVKRSWNTFLEGWIPTRFDGGKISFKRKDKS